MAQLEKLVWWFLVIGCWLSASRKSKTNNKSLTTEQPTSTFNKAGQYSTIYGMLILALSFSVMLGLFVFSNQIRDAAVKNFGEKILDTVSDKIQAGLIDMRFIANSATVNNLTYVISVPKRIGEQNYFVRGENRTFTIRTIGQRSVILRTNISDLWNVTVLGTAFSQGGQIKLDFIPPATVMLR